VPNWLRERARVLARGFALGGFGLVGGAVITLPLVGVLGDVRPIYWFSYPILVLSAITSRGLARYRRVLAGTWSGVHVPQPYAPKPKLQEMTHGWYWTGHDYHRYKWLAWYSLYFGWAVRDPATWRDLLWLLTEPIVGPLTTLLPIGLIGFGGLGVSMPWTWHTLHAEHWYLGIPIGSAGGGAFAIPVGLLFIALGVAIAPKCIAANTHYARLLLRPTRVAWLGRQVQRLSETRADAVTSQAAELRRIERDLHDGAQARLVAIGLKLGAVEALIDRDPEAAKALAAETRENSAQALGELRALVRGIHPPVLAERGLGDAVRALALDAPLPIDVTIDVPGRAEPPIEACAYFAIAETLTNIVKHAGAHRAWIDMAYRSGALLMLVSDDGRGGADAGVGGGLAGIRRRLGTFDGTLDVSSPPGGPTDLRMTLPCELSA
jgi:signal transduction histidine kinase